MWMGLRDNIDPAVAAISVVLIVLVVTVIYGQGAGAVHAKTRLRPGVPAVFPLDWAAPDR